MRLLSFKVSNFLIRQKLPSDSYSRSLRRLGMISERSLANVQYSTDLLLKLLNWLLPCLVFLSFSVTASAVWFRNVFLWFDLSMCLGKKHIWVILTETSWQ